MNKIIKYKKNQGITLIALIVMVIVLLILSGITITMITGNNSIINKSTSNEVESKNRIFLIKNKIIEYDLYLKILNKTKTYLNSTLSDLENKNKQYLEKLSEKINTYNNLSEINKDLKYRIDNLNKKFELIGGNKKIFKENETKSKIIKLKEENNRLSNEINHLENK